MNHEGLYHLQKCCRLAPNWSGVFVEWVKRHKYASWVVSGAWHCSRTICKVLKFRTQHDLWRLHARIYSFILSFSKASGTSWNFSYFVVGLVSSEWPKDTPGIPVKFLSELETEQDNGFHDNFNILKKWTFFQIFEFQPMFDQQSQECCLHEGDIHVCPSWHKAM